MTCLNDIHIQTLADGEGTDDMRRHAAACASCAARVRQREALMAELRGTVDPPVAMPSALAGRVDVRLAAEAGRRPDGATRLRPDARSPHPGADRRWLYGTLGVAAATLIAVLFVAPAVRRTDATVSAAEILAKSATQLAAPVTSGIELLEYELVLDGVPKEMMPDGADGTYHVRQAIDHNVRGRFRFASYGPDGRMLTSIAQDPRTNSRVMAFVSDGQPYRFEVTLPAPDSGMSLPEMERLHMEASIAMMQASGNQLLETVETPLGRRYRIEVPRVAGPGTNPIWDLSEARVLIDASDYRVTEFAVRGSFLKQAYSLSYTLISHSVVSSVPDDAFAVPPQPGQIVITGEGSAVPAHDVLRLALKELSGLKQPR
jgi:hypothetical protein